MWSSGGTTTTATLSNSEGYFRPLTVVETLQRVATLYLDSSRSRLFIKLACLMIIPCTFMAMIIVNYVTTHLFRSHDPTSSGYVWKNWASLVIIAGSKLFFHSCAAIVSDAAIVYTTATFYLGNARPVWTSSVQVALGKVHQLFLAGLIIFVGVFVGYACLAVPGIYIAVATSLVTPVIVLEDNRTTSLSAVDALRRSVELTAGRRWYILSCLTVMYILKYILVHVLNTTLATFGSHSAFQMWFTVGGTFLSMLPAALFVPAVAILKAVMYLSIRGEKEGLNAEILMDEVGHRSLLSPTEIFEYQEVSSTADDRTPEAEVSRI